jgi:hypothetical protein
MTNEIERRNQMSGQDWVLLGVGLCLGLSAYGVVDKVGHKHISQPWGKKIQQGYIAPNKLEVETKDLDGNGELETIMKIDGKSYLLRDANGKPVLSTYSLRPAEIVPDKK